jgi:hypothetical protein
MLDPFDQLNRHTEELLAQKQMLLVLADSHNRLNAQLNVIKEQHDRLITSLNTLTEHIVKSDRKFKVIPNDPQ